ncbi:transporter substrate-binding domain-containing protein [Pantoea agglomerans]|uniref:transporter substrate-binding domain-containing protein n=1 Tax=Enterobacter agglomerans TaxID=549 RepID=UPI001302ED2E|nr:transporter substrate-binding domain-containing protein [Pantoea agglomerans]
MSDFTDPYFTAGLVVMVKKGCKRITSPKDIAGKRVEVEKNEEMFSSLEAGRVDAVVSVKPAALLYSKARGTKEVLSEPLTQEDYGIAVSKKEPELRQQLNAALKTVRADCTYDALITKWFGAGAK